MTRIDITDVLAQDLKSRSWADDFYAFVMNTNEHELEIDFHNVKFATRSFVDEFYNKFVKSDDNRTFISHLVNVPEDIQSIFDSVSRTQVKMKTIPPVASVKQFRNTAEFLEYMNSLAF